MFFELAERENAPLVTYDQRLLKAWPAIACRPSEPGTR
jgi:predicted nucleic acid-binding protein